MATGAQFGDVLPPEVTHPVFLLFHYGIAFADGLLRRVAAARSLVSGVRRWRDAEEFLEILDLACDDDRRGAELQQLWAAARLQTSGDTPEALDLQEFRRCTKRVIAASCSVFLERISEEIARTRERWSPYQEWLKRLRQNDTIMSFNYDRVIELLSPRIPGEGGVSYGWGVHVAGIDRTTVERDREEEARMAGLPTLLKLHGSVDWTLSNGLVEQCDWSRNLLSAPNVPAIATPGPEKVNMAQSFFDRLWTAAEDSLKTADEIYLLGFRFPESDAHPREKLLAALLENNVTNLKVNTVLGPDVLGRDSRRVLELLRWTAHARVVTDSLRDTAFDHERAVVAHAMYVEDFLAVWSGLTNVPPPRGAE